MAALWQAVQTDNPTVALPAFFPAAAYTQLKAVSDPAADYSGRLIDHFDLDVAAAHLVVGGGAELIEVLQPPSGAAWIPPGSCANKVGYWHLPGVRLVYRAGGQEHSLGVASMISWRGNWYVIHLGGVLEPSGQGVVDEPATGTGSYSPQGGC